VAVVVVTAAAVAVPMAANASAVLPAKTPAQVLELVASSQVRAFSGTIEQTSDLGLPTLPTTGAVSHSSTASTLELLTGSHTARIYVDGAKDARIQVLDQLAERDAVRNGNDLWLYDSQGNTVQHATLMPRTHGIPTGSTTAMTPNQLATELLAKLVPTSTVSVGADVRVAGRSAYDLVLRPKASDTLLGSVSIAIDSATGMPLRVSVTARGQSASAVSVAFSSLSLATPASSLFTFTPPANAKVTQLKSDGATKAPKTGSTPARSVTGSGWDAVVTIPAGSSDAKLTSSSLFKELTTTVSGGRVLHTSLVNVLITTDGRILAGSVSVARLQAVAAAR
jgi:outer membrane lipoprotein-sorting protein